jgi:hypothetical protein
VVPCGRQHAPHGEPRPITGEPTARWSDAGGSRTKGSAPRLGRPSGRAVCPAGGPHHAAGAARHRASPPPAAPGKAMGWLGRRLASPVRCPAARDRLRTGARRDPVRRKRQPLKLPCTLSAWLGRQPPPQRNTQRWQQQSCRRDTIAQPRAPQSTATARRGFGASTWSRSSEGGRSCSRGPDAERLRDRDRAPMEVCDCRIAIRRGCADVRAHVRAGVRAHCGTDLRIERSADV